jgi:hypothetical protein
MVDIQSARLCGPLLGAMAPSANLAGKVTPSVELAAGQISARQKPELGRNTLRLIKNTGHYLKQFDFTYVVYCFDLSSHNA